jgi:hypothetical protein
VETFLFDDETWAICYLVVNTRPWAAGRHVLVDRHHVEDVDWGTKSIAVGRTREQVRQGPEFDADNPPPGELEAALGRTARTPRQGPS